MASQRVVRACYAHSAQRSRTTYRGRGDQQFPQAVAHRGSSLRTGARAYGGARLHRDFAPDARRRHGSGRRARRRAFRFQREAHHADLGGGRRLRHAARAGVHSSSAQARSRSHRGARTDRAERFHVFDIPQFQRQRGSGTFQVPGPAQSRRANWRASWRWGGGRATRLTKTRNSMPWSCCAATSGWRYRTMR